MKRLFSVLLALALFAGCDGVPVGSQIGHNYRKTATVDDSSKIEKTVDDMVSSVKAKDMVLTRVSVAKVMGKTEYVVAVEAADRADLLERDRHKTDRMMAE